MTSDETPVAIEEEPLERKRQRLVQVQVASTEVEARFDAICPAYVGRELHAHTRVRQRILDVLLDPACLAWPWRSVVAHCGVSEAFLERVLDGGGE